MDSYIEGFHQKIGVSQSYRDRYQQGRLHVSYEPNGELYPLLDPDLWRYLLPEEQRRRAPLEITDLLENRQRLDELVPLLMYTDLEYVIEDTPLTGVERSGVGDPRFYAQHQFWHSNDTVFRSFSGGVQLKTPLDAGNLLGSHGLDVSLFAVLGGAFSKLRWSLGLSYTHFGIREFRYLELPAEQWVLRPKIIYNLGTDWQVFSEYVMFTRPVKNMGRLSSEGHQLAVGLIRQGAENSFHVAIIENFLTYATTPDIGFYIAVDNRL